MSFSVQIFAESIQPYYSDTNRMQITLSFSSGKAICSGTIFGKKDTTSISDCTVTLCDSNGNIVSSWSDLTSSGNILNFYKSSSNITKGETYESNEGYVGYTLRCQSSINVVNKGTVICNTFSRITT